MRTTNLKLLLKKSEIHYSYYYCHQSVTPEVKHFNSLMHFIKKEKLCQNNNNNHDNQMSIDDNVYKEMDGLYLDMDEVET